MTTSSTTGTLLTASQSVNISFEDMTVGTVSISGTYTNFNVRFEVSNNNGVSWQPILGVPTHAQVVASETGILTNSSVSYSFPVAGQTNIRAVCVTAQSGSVSVTITITDDPDDTLLSLIQTIVETNEEAATTPTQSSITAAAATTTLFSSNSSRKGATVFNDSGARMYLRLGSPASVSGFSAILQPSGYYEVPYKYNGDIAAIWTAATGKARVTELI